MNNMDTDSIYLEYSKAFDKVDHRLLLCKLSKQDFHTILIDCIKSSPPLKLPFFEGVEVYPPHRSKVWDRMDNLQKDRSMDTLQKFGQEVRTYECKLKMDEIKTKKSEI